MPTPQSKSELDCPECNAFYENNRVAYDEHLIRCSNCKLVYLPKHVNLGKEKGLPHFIAFVYHPEGEVSYSGDLLTIREYLKDTPLSHGWAVPVNKGKIGVPNWTRRYYPKGYIELFGRNPLKLRLVYSQKESLFSSRQLYNGRPTYCLVKGIGLENLIRRWRRLPKRHIKELVDIRGI